MAGRDVCALPMRIITLVALFALLRRLDRPARASGWTTAKPTWVRLSLQTLTVLWLVCCACGPCRSSGESESWPLHPGWLVAGLTR